MPSPLYRVYWRLEFTMGATSQTLILSFSGACVDERLRHLSRRQASFRGAPAHYQSTAQCRTPIQHETSGKNKEPPGKECRGNGPDITASGACTPTAPRQALVLHFPSAVLCCWCGE
jgi:hypothetical protein